eukprot:7162869-Karenia_brevis.AAC.1
MPESTAEPTRGAGPSARRNGISARAWASLDDIDLRSEFRSRVQIIQSPPSFLRGPLRNALRLALQAIQRADRGNSQGIEATRAWKLLMLSSRMLLHRQAGQEKVPKEELLSRVSRFQRGEWTGLLADSKQLSGRRRPANEREQTLEKRCARAQAL